MENPGNVLAEKESAGDATVYRVPPAGKGDAVAHSSPEGRRVFLTILGHAYALALKKTRPQALLGGVTVASEEARVDAFLYQDSPQPNTLRGPLEEALGLLREGRLVLRVVGLEEALEAARSAGEPLLFQSLREERPGRVTLASMEGEGGGVSLSWEELVEGRPRFPDARGELSNASLVHWRGEATGIMLTRAHVTGYPSGEAEREYQEFLRQVELRDHVRLGREMDLFLTDPKVGAGLILWAPNGARMRRALEEYIFRLHMRRGYEPVYTPHLATGALFETSGHLQHYRENMYVFTHEGRLHAVKPMNCPFHITIFKRRRWSYRELPVRYFELGTVYRYERAGTLHGLTRVRGFTQDDAHIFLREDQIEEEVTRLLRLVDEVYSSVGIRNYRFKLSTRDPQRRDEYMGDPALWDRAEEELERALRDNGIPFTIDEGEAAFYGPKIDLFLTDALGREWQCGTIQLDFNLPKRFGLSYTDEENRERTPVLIHRAIIGTIERFTGILLEYYAGRPPLWLAPLQVAVLPIEEGSEEQRGYARRIAEMLEGAWIRTTLMAEGRLNARLREARRLRIPLIVVVGKRELQRGSVTATHIQYGVDEKGHYKPREEKLSFNTPQELVEWIRAEVARQTRGIL